MSGKSENGQFDIVSQAEKVVEAYIARYFNFAAGEPQQNRRNSKKYDYGKMDHMEKYLFVIAAIGGLVLIGFITLLFLYF